MKLRNLFDELYPGQVATVNVVPGEAGFLQSLVVQLDELDNVITRAHAINKAYYEVSYMTHIPCCRCSSPEKDMAKVRTSVFSSGRHRCWWGASVSQSVSQSVS